MGQGGGSIVVGIEDSELSDAAVQMAYRLAADRGMQVVPVHAGDLSTSWWDHLREEDLARGREATAERLSHRLASAGLDPGDLRETLQVVAGPAATALVSEAERVAAELIVLGRHRREGVLDFLGDTARGVLMETGCPVWVQSGPPREVRTVLAAVDLSPAGRHCVALAREEARAHGAAVILLHCFEHPELGAVFGYPVPMPLALVRSSRQKEEQQFHQLVAHFDWSELEHEAVFVDADPRTEILERDADLVVVGTHVRGGLRRAVLGSVASRVLRRSETPVLAFRHEPENP